MSLDAYVTFAKSLEEFNGEDTVGTEFGGALTYDYNANASMSIGVSLLNFGSMYDRTTSTVEGFSRSGGDLDADIAGDDAGMATLFEVSTALRF